MEVREFILVRLAEAEAVASTVVSGPPQVFADCAFAERGDVERALFREANNPIHVVRTVAAIQRVMVVLDNLADLASETRSWGVADGVTHAYNSLAWIWRDHPDHDPSWAPDGWLQVAVGSDT